MTLNEAKERMKVPDGRVYEAERQRRLDTAVKSGRTPVQVRLDDEEISLSLWSAFDSIGSWDTLGVRDVERSQGAHEGP